MKNITVYGITNRNQGKRNGTVLFNIDGIDSSTVCDVLNEKYKIAVRGGWHCSYPAHCALGSDKSGAIRASFGAFSSMRDMNILTNSINDICKKEL